MENENYIVEQAALMSPNPRGMLEDLYCWFSMCLVDFELLIHSL